MKALAFLPVILCSAAVLAAEEIPVRSPVVGESRPGWWLSCWADHVVVIEGKIRVKKGGEPDVTVTVDPKVAKWFFDKEGQELQKSFSTFSLGKVEPKRVLFASPGIKFLNGNMESAARGNATPLAFLMPLLSMDGRNFMTEDVDQKEDVFIFKYGSLLSGVPLVYKGRIPEDGMKSAQKVFEHRTRLDHLSHLNKKEAE
ncbi:MAG: hypothetical protein EOP83_11295 [Verrucomicrobiaceae bacterium]|nr:MAG: hypothetical protein EOP83_11295 [Verrucomicrobiaceae bacterium]